MTRTTQEEFHVNGEELLAKVKKLIELPLTVGVVGAVLAQS